MSVWDDVKAWPVVTCRTCQRPFARAAPYLRTCPLCFKTTKGYKLLASDHVLARLQDEIVALNARVQIAEARNPAASGPPLSSERLSQLLLLCHPDKHKNSVLSNEVTRWILGQRKAP